MRRTKYNWQLPIEIERRLGNDTYGRQRALYEKDHLLIVLHKPPFEDQEIRETVLFLRDPQGQYFCNGYENGEQKLRRLLDDYDQLFDGYEERYRKSSSSQDLFSLLENMSPVSRAMQNCSQALQQARSFIVGDTFLISMRDRAEELARNYELLSIDAKLVLERKVSENSEIQAAKAHEMATAQHKLNVLAAITFPLMGIATLLGMNLQHGMEEQSPIWFWAAVIGSMLIGFVVRGWVVKKTSA